MRLSLDGMRNDPKAVPSLSSTCPRATFASRTSPAGTRKRFFVGMAALFSSSRSERLQRLYARESTDRKYQASSPVQKRNDRLGTYFSSYSPLKAFRKGLPGAMWSAGSDRGRSASCAGLASMKYSGGRANGPSGRCAAPWHPRPNVEFKPADHLLGLSCHDKIMRLQKDYPAGHCLRGNWSAAENYENCYFGAVALSTENLLKSGDDKCQLPGRGGMGSVMAYKRYMAIVAQAPDQLGKLKPEIRDINRETGTGPGSRKFREINKGGLGGTWSGYETWGPFSLLPQNNFRPKGDDKPKLMARPSVEPQFVIKAESCFRCGINCHKNVYEKIPRWMGAGGSGRNLITSR